VSEENLSASRRLADAFNASDVETQLVSLLAPDYHIDNIVTAVTDKTYYGVPGCLQWLRDFRRLCSRSALRAGVGHCRHR
jgi:hypothetical protein